VIKEWKRGYNPIVEPSTRLRLGAMLSGKFRVLGFDGEQAGGAVYEAIAPDKKHVWVALLASKQSATIARFEEAARAAKAADIGTSELGFSYAVVEDRSAASALVSEGPRVTPIEKRAAAAQWRKKVAERLAPKGPSVAPPIAGQQHGAPAPPTRVSSEPEVMSLDPDDLELIESRPPPKADVVIHPIPALPKPAVKLEGLFDEGTGDEPVGNEAHEQEKLAPPTIDVAPSKQIAKPAESDPRTRLRFALLVGGGVALCVVLAAIFWPGDHRGGENSGASSATQAGVITAPRDSVGVLVDKPAETTTTPAVGTATETATATATETAVGIPTAAGSGAAPPPSASWGPGPGTDKTAPKPKPKPNTDPMTL
jgi:hypothetical protein